MRGSPIVPLLLWSSCCGIAFSHLIPPIAASANTNSRAEIWRSDDAATVKFHAACKQCLDENESQFLFKLAVSSTENVCGESDISLNGKPLNIRWDGESAAGADTISAHMTNGSGPYSLAIDYRSLCVTSPSDSIEKYAAQILTVTFHPRNDSQDNGSAGFALSYNPVGKPEIFRLVTSPISISDNDPSFDFWMDSSDLDNPQTPTTIPGDHFDNDRLEDELQRLGVLKSEVQKLEQMIQTKDDEIRKLISQDCASLTSRLKQCSSLKCFVKTSFSIVPDIFRLMKYRFWSLPSSSSERPCRHSGGVDVDRTPGQAHNVSTLAVAAPESGRKDNSSIQTTGMEITPPLPPTQRPDPHILSQSPLAAIKTKKFVRHVAIVCLVFAILYLVYKQCRNTISWRRRRVDMAARREERRARNAYRNAARRHRWRQWWSRWFPQRSQIPNNQSQHNLTTLDDEEEAGNTGSNTQQGADRDQLDGTGVQAEILGFRRVLELVGELIRPDGDRDRDPSFDRRRQNQQHTAELGAAGTYTATEAPSSTAPLTTIGSPRTSSVLSYETDSVTLDSLDPETATMFSTS
ncbi:hypothetical protein AJ80_05442 [Polytolypa hystricis UAMH7299]|uniref:GOLD domain-containing protein n=1 Tax=Polytolypa hystricis (strain UAMH7299) TaxID=1447883 RepID=A0A2B7XVE6_POLH7|nr:hypothetical protein AJ80_05442 [Polytolypa hystricis UAMH7299]